MANKPFDENEGLTSQLREWRGSTRFRNHQAAGPLFNRIYGDLVRIATTVNFSKDIDPRELVSQLYMRWDHATLREWNSRVEFFNLAKVALRNLVIDRYREAKAFQHAVPLNDNLAAETAELEYIRYFDAVEDIGNDLGPVYADILTLKYLSSDTDAQIAAAIGVSESTAKRYYAAADIELRKRMGLPPKAKAKTSDAPQSD